MQPLNTFYDVIIAGAGPVGLFHARELRLGGASVLVLERKRDPYSPLKGLPFGLRGLTVPTIESLDRRDLLTELEAYAASKDTRAASHWMQQQRRPAGHFAGIQFFHDQIDTARWSYRLPGAVGSLAVDMASIEAVLAQRAEKLGAEIRRGCGVETLDACNEGVRVYTSEGTCDARWLVGCDGGRSIVRKAAGFSFVGTDPEFTGYSVEAELIDTSDLKLGRHYTATGMYTFTAPGTIAMVDFDGGARHRSEPTREHIETVLRKVSGTSVTVKSLHVAATWTDRAYQATEYRRGRVLLAGDAAHIHSPLGGRGLNLGLGDAMNLGWKLAATIRGVAPEGLLDSYTSERHPIGARVLDWSRAQVAIMRPSSASRALAAVVRDLIGTRDGATYFAERVLGVGLRYDLGAGHPLVGRSAPDFQLGEGTRLAERLRSGRGLLLDFGASVSLGALAARWYGRIDYIQASSDEHMEVGALLVRPDGIVAWACDGTPNDDFERAAKHWFGDPHSRSHP
ncbi:FAD-dependent monooxygenase [Sphingomonas nostoxanthinifaciens]|uniref:FAD-dependent monooxygenase n=1 Tax=Sphingomonas nostoxanthinifaciens TaxID=2872652 RepID=UPI001CC1CE89|nr:FAD-dependent monooxygenase [Sphingomonas nostoxanthinifaciens]UAK25301.1 FAD-dependent monooxygenase [Sphingomonas nostoxanthinifaciens]